MKNKKILTKLDEFMTYKNLCIDDISFEECDHLISLSANNMGILNEFNIYIWCGFNPHSDDIRIKVTNNKSIKDRTFVINVNTLEITGEFDKEVITKDVMDNLLRWCKLNTSALNKFSEDGDVDYFYNSLVKI